MKKTAYTIGVEAEEMVAAHYRDQGYKITHTRYKTKYGEIDLVATNNNMLAFIEVKARNNPLHMELLSPAQIKRNCNAALVFLAENDTMSHYDIRFDYAEVINGKISQIIENAWEFEG